MCSNLNKNSIDKFYNMRYCNLRIYSIEAVMSYFSSKYLYNKTQYMYLTLNVTICLAL